MARVTIEDCTKYVPSRFELVVLAAERAKAISSGAPLTVEKSKAKNDKNAVLALREIGAGNIDIKALKESVIKKFQKRQSPDAADKPGDDMSEDRMEIYKDLKNYHLDELDEAKEVIYADEQEVAEEIEEN